MIIFSVSLSAKQLPYCAGSRVVGGHSVYDDDSTDDCFGHGTHVSGIVGGLQYGVAKNVTIIPGRHIRIKKGHTLWLAIITAMPTKE